MTATETPNVDYRALLAKYIQHVGDEEGVDFLDWRESHAGTQWTDAEWEALQALRSQP